MADTDPLLDKEFDGRYRIEAVLGEGGIGRVYSATHLKLGRRVAIKVLLEEHRERPSVRARFAQEAKTLASLQHPNIVTITDFGMSDDLPFLVMEQVEGRELNEVLRDEGMLDPGRALAIFRQILGGLAYAHQEDLVHRDLKPANVLLRQLPDGREHAELLDFGLAKFITEPANAPKLTQVGMVVGTPAYMAPEQIEPASVDARTDIYSAGVILYELLTGHLPFPSGDTATVLRAHLITPPPSLRESRPEIPTALEAVVLRALQKKPADRFATAQEMLVALEAALSNPVERSSFPTMDQVIARLAPATEKLVAGVTPATDAARDALSTGVRTMRRLPKSLLYGIAAGFIAVIALVAIAVASREDEPLPESAPTTATVEDLPTFVPVLNQRPEPRDPWSEPVPEALAAIKARLDRNRSVSRRALTTLHRFAREHPDDARPKILHARAYVVRGRLTQAFPHYLEAFRRDPSARGDAQMRRDLVRMARTPNLHEDATQAVVKIYGPEAAADVSKLIEETRRPADRERLQVLQAKLAE